MATQRTNRLTGLNPLAYVGVEPVSPPQLVQDKRAPTITDYSNWNIGSIWIYINVALPVPNQETVYMLVDKSKGIATWVPFAGGAGIIITLTGNSGGPVSPFGGNINVIGDGTSINVVGNPGTHTLTISAIGGGVVTETLTGNSGGAVSPLAGNINVVGDTTTINIVGNPGTHTLTASVVGTGVVQTLTANSGGAVSPLAGNINVVGDTTTINIVGNPGTHTLTASTGSTVATSYVEDSGTAVPSAGILNVIGGTSVGGFATNINTIGSGNTVTVCLNNNISLPNTNTAGTTGIYLLGGNRFISNYGTNNTFVGQTSGNTSLTTANAINNTGVGASALVALTTGFGNCAFGKSALAAATTGSTNVAIGPATLSALTSGTSNTAVGWLSSQNLVTGINNTSVGAQSLFTMNGAAASNVAVGANALEFLTSGSSNTAIGTGALANVAVGLTTGSLNIGIGALAGSNYTGAESSNIIIGNIATVGESNVIRVGTPGGAAGQQNKCFVAGIRGITTDVNDAIAVLISSTGQLGTVSSSARFKQDIEDMKDHSSFLMNLRPVVFAYKKNPERKQFGLIAEEVAKIESDLVVYDEEGLPYTVKYHDLPALILNELQKLNVRVKNLEKQLSFKK